MWPPAILARLLDMTAALAVGLLVVGALLGGYRGHRAAKHLEPRTRREDRDAVIGWSVVVVLIGVVVSLALPMPWVVAAACAWTLVVAVGARALLTSALSERAEPVPQ